MNIKLPLMVGEVVNVISEFAKDTTRNFIDDIKKPALRLIATYLIQVMEVSNFIDDIKKTALIFVCFVVSQVNSYSHGWMVQTSLKAYQVGAISLKANQP